MKSTRILLSLTLLVSGSHTFGASSSAACSSSSEGWAVVDASKAPEAWERSCLCADKLDKETGAVIKANAYQLGAKKQYLYAQAPTATALKDREEAQQYITQEAKDAKKAFLKKMGLYNAACAEIASTSNNIAAEAYSVFIHQDARAPHKELARLGKGMQRVKICERAPNSVLITDACFVKPSSAHAQHTDIWTPYFDNGTTKHEDHKVEADYEWTKEGSSWQPQTVSEHTRGWKLSTQSMTRTEKKAKQEALVELIKHTTAHRITDSKGNVILYEATEKGPSEEVLSSRSYNWQKDEDGKWHPVATYASVAAPKVSVAPATIAAIRNALREKEAHLATLLTKPKDNIHTIDATRLERDALKGELNHKVAFLNRLQESVLPAQKSAADKRIAQLSTQRDTLIKELGLSPKHAYYIQATLDALQDNCKETNVELSPEEMLDIAFGHIGNNHRAALTKICAEITRHVPDSSWIVSYKPTTVAEYHAKQAELIALRNNIDQENDNDKKLALIDQAKEVEFARNALGKANMNEATSYVNSLVATNKCWKDIQEVEGKMHDLLYILADLRSAEATKAACADAHQALVDQLDIAEGKRSKAATATPAASSSSSSSSSQKKVTKNKGKGKAKQSRRGRRKR